MPAELVVTFNVPLADADETKHGPAVMNSKPVTLNDPSPFTVNVVTKLSPEASPLPPLSTACQVPLEVVVAGVLLLPQPEMANSSARSATTISRFMFILRVRLGRGISQGCQPLPNGCQALDGALRSCFDIMPCPVHSLTAWKTFTSAGVKKSLQEVTPRAISRPRCWVYPPEGVIVNVPFPLQPEVTPDSVHVPLICPLLTVPFKLSVFTSAPVLMMVY